MSSFPCLPRCPDRSFLCRALAVVAAVGGFAAAAPLPADAQLATLTRLHTFSRIVDGCYPDAPLMQARDGGFYGTAIYDYHNKGLIYKITAAGTFTTLHTFQGDDGANPTTALVQAANGDFYGTTDNGYGDANVPATIFRLKADGTLTTLHSFKDYEFGASALIQAADGDLYGTTYGRGNDLPGTVFRMTTDGGYTTLHTFDEAEGAHAGAALVQGRDGNFYGATYAGGEGDFGTIYKITPDGTFTTLHRFSGADGDGLRPLAPLIQAADGDLYGTTSDYNSTSRGTVFKITPDGTLTTLHRFAEGEGGDPHAALVQTADGNFYGVAGDSVFRMTPGGFFTTIYQFQKTNGSDPQALIQGADGDLYGVTQKGGANSYGTVYKLTPYVPPGPPKVKLKAYAASVPVGDVYYALFKVKLTHPALTDLQIHYTVAGSATPDVDYNLLSGTVTFKAGETYQSIGVLPHGDLGGAAKKTLKLKLAPGDGYTVGTETAAKVKFTRP